MSLWLTFLMSWATVYAGLPNCILIDCGSKMGNSQIFADLAADFIDEMKTTSIECHLGKQRINRALKHNAGSFAETMFDSGDQILVWSDKIFNNRIGELLSPTPSKALTSKRSLCMYEMTRTALSSPQLHIMQVILPLDKMALLFMADL